MGLAMVCTADGYGSPNGDLDVQNGALPLVFFWSRPKSENSRTDTQMFFCLRLSSFAGNGVRVTAPEAKMVGRKKAGRSFSASRVISRGSGEKQDMSNGESYSLPFTAANWDDTVHD